MGKDVDLDQFGLNQKVCRECKREYNQRRYKAKRKEIIGAVVEWKRKNKVKVRAYKNTWESGHLGRKNELASLNYNRIENKIWRLVTKAIQVAMKGYPILFQDYGEIIGASKLILFQSLSSNFSKGMHRGNFGSRKLQWSIGFTVPLSAFDLTTREGQGRAFSHLNMKPLWSRQKADKGDLEGLREVA